MSFVLVGTFGRWDAGAEGLDGDAGAGHGLVGVAHGLGQVFGGMVQHFYHFFSVDAYADVRDAQGADHGQD